MELLIVLFFLSPITFLVGILIAIISKEQRTLGLIMALVSVVVAVIGLSICSRMILIHGAGHHDDEEENEVNPVFFVLEYAPTTDTTFCFPEINVPTDDLMGNIYFGPSNKMLHYANTLGAWDSLRIETGVYLKKEDSIISYFKEQWIIPYTSQDMHSIEKLDFDKAVRKKMDTTHRFVLIKNKKCKEYPYYSIHTEQEYVGLVYKYVTTNEEVSLEIVRLIKAWDLYLQSNIVSDTVNATN